MGESWGGEWMGCSGGQQSRLRSSSPTAAARLWSSAFWLSFVYLAQPRCGREGQWTAGSEWGGAPLSSAPWTPHRWLRAQQAPQAQRHKESWATYPIKNRPLTIRAGSVLLTSHNITLHWSEGGKLVKRTRGGGGPEEDQRKTRRRRRTRGGPEEDQEEEEDQKGRSRRSRKRRSRTSSNTYYIKYECSFWHTLNTFCDFWTVKVSFLQPRHWHQVLWSHSHLLCPNSGSAHFKYPPFAVSPKECTSVRPAGHVRLLLNGTVYPSEHFLVGSPDVPAPTSTSLFIQPRSVKVTRRFKFDCQICLSFRNSLFPF